MYIQAGWGQTRGGGKPKRRGHLLCPTPTEKNLTNNKFGME